MMFQTKVLNILTNICLNTTKRFLMNFNEYCTLNLVKGVQFVSTMEESLLHCNYSPSTFILFVGTKEEEDLFKGILVAFGYDPTTKVKRFDDVLSVFNTYSVYSVRTHFFSTQEHIEKSGIPYHTW